MSAPYTCYGGCGREFETLEDMTPVPGSDGRSPRHFCEHCAERLRRGPPLLTDGGTDQSEGSGQQYPDVLVRADPDELTHKRREKMEDPWSTECYWTVNGRPQRTGRGGMMLFHDGKGVWGTATVTRVEDGRIWFKPIRDAGWATFEVPEPPTRGFTYVGGDGGD